MEDSQLLDWQQSSINPTMENEKHTTIMDEQQLREELIQRATTRLRRRLLEESLSEVMERIIKMQTHLETIRVDTQTTIGSVTNMLDDDDNLKLNRQMDVLERRLKSHEADLQSLIIKEEEEKIKAKVFEQQEEAPQPSATMSRLSSLSLMSSIFGTRSSSVSSKATSICSDEDDAKIKHHHHFVSELTEEEKRDRRRRRVRHQRQRYEESLKSRDGDDDCISQINGSETYDDKIQLPTCLVVQEKNTDDVEAPFYDLSGKRSFHAGSFCGSVYCKEQKPVPPQAHDNIRRKRRQWQKKIQDSEQDTCYYSLQKYHQSNDDNDTCLFDCNDSDISSVMMSDSISTLSSFIPDLHHPLSPMTPPPDYYYYNEDSFGSSSKNYMQCDTKLLPQDEWTLENLNQHHHHRMLPLYPQRNVLDDCMSFLDGLSENGEDDNGLREDMCLLLRNPDLCCRPLSEIQGTMNELRSKDKAALVRLLNPATWIQLGVDTTVSAAYKTACTSLEWCRFLSVLSAAVVISLSKGPDDLISPC